MIARSVNRGLGADGGAGTGRALDDDLPAQALGPLAHRREAEAAFPDGAGAGVEADAVVVHGDRHRAAARVDVDGDRPRPRVAHSIVERFLHDAVQLDLAPRVALRPPLPPP